jgi:hypothetical protein
MGRLEIIVVAAWMSVLIGCSRGGDGIAPCTTGETRACHVTLSGSDVVSCIAGTETCGGGTWGECVVDGTITSRFGGSGSLTSDSSGAHTMGLAPQQCVNDPCDPACMYFSDGKDGGVTPTKSDGGAYQTGSVALSALPNGWTKVDKTPCSTSADCEFDSHCFSGTCTAYNTGDKNSCTGVDFTAPSGCESTTSTLFPICNRGSADATTGTINVGFDQNPPPSGMCAPASGSGYPAKGTCVVDLSKTPIKAGSCIDIDPVNLVNVKSCTGINASGNRDVFPNYDGKFAECNLCNNEGMKKAGSTCTATSLSTYAPVTTTQTYVATCSGTKVPEWSGLAWTATTPSSGGTSSKITFVAAIGSVGADGGATSLGSSVTLGTTPTDPATCGLFGPSPCPKDIPTLMGGAKFAVGKALQLTITLTPSTDGLAAPTLTNWQVTYTCVDGQ